MGFWIFGKIRNKRNYYIFFNSPVLFFSPTMTCLVAIYTYNQIAMVAANVFSWPFLVWASHEGHIQNSITTIITGTRNLNHFRHSSHYSTTVVDTETSFWKVKNWWGFHARKSHICSKEYTLWSFQKDFKLFNIFSPQDRLSGDLGSRQPLLDTF